MAGLVGKFALALLALSVTACGATKKESKSDVEAYDESEGISIARMIGTEKNPPDEFAVMTTKPLEMPQDFAALPTPNPGQRSLLSPDPVAEARSVLLGDPTPQAANARMSVSESALVSAAGTAPPSNIRSVLETEQATADAAGQEYLLDEYFPNRRTANDLKNTIRPEEERVRLSTLSPASQPSGIGTIPSAPRAAVPQTTEAIPAQPVVNPVTGTELIFIPE